MSDATDCNGARPDVFPGAMEVWYDGVDQDCDGTAATRPVPEDTGEPADRGEGAVASPDDTKQAGCGVVNTLPGSVVPIVMLLPVLQRRRAGRSW